MQRLVSPLFVHCACRADYKPAPKRSPSKSKATMRCICAELPSGAAIQRLEIARSKSFGSTSVRASPAATAPSSKVCSAGCCRWSKYACQASKAGSPACRATPSPRLVAMNFA